MPNRQEELTAMLRELRLPTMATSCAQLALKANHPHPHYWGAFICQGDPDSLSGEKLEEK